MVNKVGLIFLLKNAWKMQIQFQAFDAWSILQNRSFHEYMEYFKDFLNFLDMSAGYLEMSLIFWLNLVSSARFS